jgi:hypothetical protein
MLAPARRFTRLAGRGGYKNPGRRLAKRLLFIGAQYLSGLQIDHVELVAG